jgi:hypothetical protein
VREDELTRILQAGATVVTETVRPRPPEVIRARGNRRRRHQRLGAALLALAVIAAGGGVYAGVHTGTGALPASHRPTPGPHVHVDKGVPVPSGNPTPGPGGSMLPAGKVGSRAQIPVSSVDSSWTLTEFSTGAVGGTGNWRQGGGQLTLSLVDPEGGRYTLYQQANTGQPWTLLAVGGGDEEVLLGVGTPDSQGRYPGYRTLSISTGAVTTFAAPADVTPGGFNFSGQELLTVRRTRTHAWLQEYSLTGRLETTLASEDIPPGGASSQLCAPSCNALLQPDGSSVAWNDGTGLQLVGTMGGTSRPSAMTVPGAGSNCVPLRWWDDQTVLASCGTGTRARLWLTRWDGQPPRALTPPGSAASAYGPYTGAWNLSGTIYVNRAAGGTCLRTGGGPETSGFYSVARDGALSPLLAPGSTQSNLVGTDGGALLVLARTGCPGGAGLMVFYANTPSELATWLQPAPAGQAGVVAATSAQ